MKEHDKSSVVAHLSLVAPILMQIKESLSLPEPTENGFQYPLQDSTTQAVRKVFSNLPNGEVKAVNGDIATDCGCLNGGGSAGIDPHTRLAMLEVRTQVFENIISVLNREMDSANGKLAAALEQKNEEQQKVKACEQKVRCHYYLC